MFRLALVSYLMAVVLAGPWLCCCGLSRLAASQSTKQASARDQHQTKANAGASCCQHRARAKPVEAKTDRHATEEHRHPVDHSSCPCREQSTLLVSAAPASGTSAHDFEPSHSDLPGELIVTTQVDLASARGNARNPHGGHVLPFLSTHDLLYHLHILRC